MEIGEDDGFHRTYLMPHRSLNQLSQGESTALHEAHTPLEQGAALAEKRRAAGSAFSGVPASLRGLEATRVLHGLKATSTIQ
jgi:hypothetical protein